MESAPDQFRDRVLKTHSISTSRVCHALLGQGPAGSPRGHNTPNTTQDVGEEKIGHLASLTNEISGVWINPTCQGITSVD